MSGAVRRGQVYRVPPVNREYLVISIDMINDCGTAIVTEVDPRDTWTGARNLLVIAFDDSDVPAGRSVLTWRVNYISADRLTQMVGVVGEATLDRVTAALRAAIEP